MNDFQNAVGRGRLKKLAEGSQSFVDELRRALVDLGHALSAWTHFDYRRVIENSHFAMRRFAEAAIQARGYRSTNKHGLRLGLQALWITPADLPDDAIHWIDNSGDYYESPPSDRADLRDAAMLTLTWAITLGRELLAKLQLPDTEFDPSVIPESIPGVAAQTSTTGRGRRPQRGEKAWQQPRKSYLSPGQRHRDKGRRC